MRAYVLELQLFLERFFSLVQAAELVDLLLVLATDLDLVARGDLVVFGKLPCGRVSKRVRGRQGECHAPCAGSSWL